MQKNVDLYLSLMVISFINLRENSQNYFFYLIPDCASAASSSNFVTDFATYTSRVAQVKLPDYWYWTYHRYQKTIFCTCTGVLPDGAPIMQAVKILNSQEVAYYLNSQIIVPIGLDRRFTCFEDISKLIIHFDRLTSCSGIDPSLQEVEVPALLAGIQNKCRLKVQARVAGMLDMEIFRSKNCSILAVGRRNLMCAVQSIQKLPAEEAEKLAKTHRYNYKRNHKRTLSNKAKGKAKI